MHVGTHTSRVLMLFAAAAVGVACSRQVPGRAVESEPVAAYDPERDPLVNPPELFAPFPEDQPELAEPDPTLVRRLVNSPTLLNPIFSILWEDHALHGQLFVNPFRRNREMEFEINPEVVPSWEESEDHLTFTLRLDPRLRWQDGRPWTAHDVEFSYRAIVDDAVPSLFYKLAAERLADVRALDDHTVEYVHRQVLATRVKDMALPVIPRHIFDNSVERAKDATLRSSAYFNRYGREEVIGSGPYRLAKWAAQDEIVLERWEDFPLFRPRFKRQVLKILPDPNIALLMFKKGDLHEMQLSGQQFVTQTNDQDFRRFGVKAWAPLRMVGALGFNQDSSNPFFADLRVRRALAHAFDRDRFLRDALYGVYTSSRGIFDPAHWAYNPSIELIPHDLERAAELLEEAGWKTDPEDGWRYREIDGRRVRFEFEMMLGQGNPIWVRLAAIFDEDLRRIGVKLEPRFFEVASLVERLRRHDFQSYLAVVEVTSDPDEWGVFWRTDGYDDGYNYVGYSNSRVDELFDLARAELDRERRRPLYQEIQQILYEEQSFLFIWDYTLMWAFSNRLRGVSLSPSGPILFFPGPRDWWMAKELASMPSSG